MPETIATKVSVIAKFNDAGDTGSILRINNFTDIGILKRRKTKRRAFSLSRCLPSVTAVSVVVSVISLSLSCPSAFRASLGLIFETLFLVECLLTFGKNKFCSAIFADNCLISHFPNLLNYFGLNIP